MLWELGRITVEQGELAEAKKAVDDLRGLPPNKNFDPVLIDYLQARIEAAQGHWQVASRAFEDVARQLEHRQCAESSRERLRNCSRRSSVDWQAATSNWAMRMPNWPHIARRPESIRFLSRRGWAWLPRYLRSVRSTRRWRSIGRSADWKAWPQRQISQMARLLILKNLRLPVAERDWKEVEAILDRLKQASPDATDVTLLRAEMLFGQGRAEETEKLLTAATGQISRENGNLVGLGDVGLPAATVGPRGKPARSSGQEVRRPRFLRLARGQYLLSRYGKKSASDLVKLGDNASRFSAEDRRELCRSVAMYLREAGDLEHAKQFAGQACQADPANLAARLLLFELTYFSGDVSGMEKVLSEIRSFQSEGPLWHFGEAVRLAVLAEREPQAQKRTTQFRQALEHLSAAHDQRPGWGRIPLLAGQLYDRLGQVDPAIENYCKAIDAGETSPDHGPPRVRIALQSATLWGSR